MNDSFHITNPEIAWVACDSGTDVRDGMDAASAAFEAMNGSAIRFNQEYSRFFGQAPMRDIRALLVGWR